MSYPPTEVGPFTIEFPEPFDVGGEEHTQMVFTFNRTAERAYGNMVAARYEATMIPDPIVVLNFCFVAHTDTGHKDTMSDLLCKAFARWHVTRLYNIAKSKDFDGVSRPLSQELLDTLDGTARPRGMCGACRVVHWNDYPTVSLTLPAYWHEEEPS